MNGQAKATVDPNDPAYHGRPLWVIHGHECAPGIMCVMLRAYTAGLDLLPVGQIGEVCIWGYSVYAGSLGFRTLGVKLTTWTKRSTIGPLFYVTLEDALFELRRLLTPAAECPGVGGARFDHAPNRLLP